MKGQERNMAQLERIGAIIEWRWSLKKNPQGYRKESEIEEDGDDKKGSENNPRESQEEGTLLPASY